MIFDIRIIFTIQKDKKRQNDIKTNKDRIIKKQKDKKRQNNKETNKDRRIKRDRRTKRQKGKKTKSRRRFILSTWHCYDRVPTVLLRFILIAQQAVARLILRVIHEHSQSYLTKIAIK